MGYLEAECAGCMGANKSVANTHGSLVGLCTMLPKTKGVICPCLRCLIKVMCEKDCIELKDYHFKTKKHRRVPYESTKKVKLEE